MRNRLTFHSNILLSVSRHGWCSGSFYNWNEWPRKWRSLTCANMTLSSSKCRPAWPVRLLTLADAITQQLLRFPLPHLLVAFISHFFKKIASFFPVFLPNLFFSLLSSSLYFRRKVQDNRLTIALKKNVQEKSTIAGRWRYMTDDRESCRFSSSKSSIVSNQKFETRVNYNTWVDVRFGIWSQDREKCHKDSRIHSPDRCPSKYVLFLARN